MCGTDKMCHVMAIACQKGGTGKTTTAGNLGVGLAKMGKKVLYTELGEMLFTHFGVSGPLVLSASSNMQKHPVDSYRMAIDFKPALSAEELDKRILSDFAKYAARDFINALSDLLPQKLIPYVTERSGIDPRKKVSAVTRAERLKLGEVLKAYELTPKAFRPVDEAIVTSGGVDVREISPKTMESKKVKRLYFAGEIMDVDGYTGGFNLQIAWSTAYCAAKAILEMNE